MSLLGAISVTRRRRTAGSYVDGYWVEGTATDASVSASVQPMRGREREILPEGVRVRDVRKLYVADRTALAIDDEVQLDGDWFTVIHVDTSHPLVPHTRAFVVRVPEGAA